MPLKRFTLCRKVSYMEFVTVTAESEHEAKTATRVEKRGVPKYTAWQVLSKESVRLDGSDQMKTK